MKNRKDKGVIFVLIIILACIAGFFSTTGDDSFWHMGNQAAPGSDLMNIPTDGKGGSKEEKTADANQLPSNYMEQDISLTDSFYYEGQEGEENRENSQEESLGLAFFRENFSYQRKGSENLLGWVTALLVTYLIIIGPVSYFYLKKIGKMERLWLILPLCSVFFGVLILLMGNGFAITTPQMDVLRIDSPGKESICYGSMTSPGDETYRVSFNEHAKALQSVMIWHDYKVLEETRTLILHPDHVFEKAYIQYSLTEQCRDKVSFVCSESEEGISGTVFVQQDKEYESMMFCYEDWFYIVDKTDGGERILIDAGKWESERIGLKDSIKEELHLHSGLSEDEEQIFNFAWYLHRTQGGDTFHIAAISKECETAVKEEEMEIISYGLFFQ